MVHDARINLLDPLGEGDNVVDDQLLELERCSLAREEAKVAIAGVAPDADQND